MRKPRFQVAEEKLRLHIKRYRPPNHHNPLFFIRATRLSDEQIMAWNRYKPVWKRITFVNDQYHNDLLAKYLSQIEKSRATK